MFGKIRHALKLTQNLLYLMPILFWLYNKIYFPVDFFRGKRIRYFNVILPLKIFNGKIYPGVILPRKIHYGKITPEVILPRKIYYGKITPEVILPRKKFHGRITTFIFYIGLFILPRNFLISRQNKKQI